MLLNYIVITSVHKSTNQSFYSTLSIICVRCTGLMVRGPDSKSIKWSTIKSCPGSQCLIKGGVTQDNLQRHLFVQQCYAKKSITIIASFLT